jgi:hypothetical protein
MHTTSFENVNHIKGQSKPYATKQLAKYFPSVNLIEIPPLIALKFDLRDGDRLLWDYYDDKKVAIITKREGRGIEKRKDIKR